MTFHLNSGSHLTLTHLQTVYFHLSPSMLALKSPILQMASLFLLFLSLNPKLSLIFFLSSHNQTAKNYRLFLWMHPILGHFLTLLHGITKSWTTERLSTHTHTHTHTHTNCSNYSGSEHHYPYRWWSFLGFPDVRICFCGLFSRQQEKIPFKKISSRSPSAQDLQWFLHLRGQPKVYAAASKALH